MFQGHSMCHSSRKTFQRHSRTFQTFQSFQSFPDIPVIPDTPETFQTFQSFMTFQPFQAILQFYKVPSIPRESNPLQHSLTRMHILQCSTDSTVRLVSTENSTEYQLGNYKHFYKHYILQRKGDVAISVRTRHYSPK